MHMTLAHFQICAKTYLSLYIEQNIIILGLILLMKAFLNFSPFLVMTFSQERHVLQVVIYQHRSMQERIYQFFLILRRKYKDH